MATPRDKVWHTVFDRMEYQRSYTVSAIQEAIEGEPPSESTIRNTLKSMENYGFIRSEGGSGRTPRKYFPQQPDSDVEPLGYSPQSGTHAGTFPYPGSKANLSDWIISNMPTHDTYVEVFGGSAGVLYNKPLSKYEIYNDINKDLAQFFSVLQNQPDELADWLRVVPYSREVYENWVNEYYDGHRPDDPIKRAGRFFTLRYMQYVGISSSANGFKARARRSPARTFNNARDRIQSLAARFEEVTIENKDYKEILEDYDDPHVDVLFYADPPYIGAEDQYEEVVDHEEFIKFLSDVENDWMVSYSEIPDGLEEYTVLERQSRHRMKRTSNSTSERLICNFDPEERPAFENDYKNS